jgi:dihydrolipoamide dehydrogenase
MVDVAIIGAGAGGISCAKEAIKFKLNAVIVERDINSFGGICINRGCIPAKFLIKSSQLNKDWGELIKKENEIINNIKSSLFNYLNKRIEIVWGEASFGNRNTLEVGKRKIKAKNIIIASGSFPRKVEKIKNALPAEEVFQLSTLPSKFLIIGAGSVGVEMASLLNSLGKVVWLIEKEDRILPHFPSHISRRLKLILEKRGIKIILSSHINNFNLNKFDSIILAGGRDPNYKNLKAKEVGLLFDEGGWIKTNAFMRTNLDNIYACGDVTGKKLLAYIADYQAKLCISNIMGKDEKEDYSVLPECAFSIPQVAKVGILEEEAKQKNFKYKTLKTNFLRFSSAYTYGDRDGYMEICLDEKEKIVGAGIISNIASELISIFTLAVKNKLTLKELASCIFIHPTLSEIITLFLKEVE